MSANNVMFDPADRLYYFDGIPVRQEKIGRAIAEALAAGSEWVELGGVPVTVNYLVQMLRFTGRHGWFNDVWDDTADHRWDPNSPTPGYRWSEAQDLRRDAAAWAQMADDEKTVSGRRACLSQSQQLGKLARKILHGGHRKRRRR